MILSHKRKRKEKNVKENRKHLLHMSQALFWAQDAVVNEKVSVPLKISRWLSFLYEPAWEDDGCLTLKTREEGQLLLGGVLRGPKGA